MSVWFCIPSKRPPEQAGPLLAKWRERGYKIALWRDDGNRCPELEDAAYPLSYHNVILSAAQYPGYAVATNTLIARVLELDPACTFCVIGGDDVEPDQRHTAGEIEFDCGRHFGEAAKTYRMEQTVSSIPNAPREGRFPWSTFGVMQPTGDRWGENSAGVAYADRVCGSAWLGREFCQRIYGGRGPLWPEFFHMFVDEHLQNVAGKLGILWQRRDLIQLHQHALREKGAAVPEFLKQVYSQQHWNESQAIFRRLQRAGFQEANDLG